MGTMPSKRDENTKAKAVRLVHKHQRRLRHRVGGDVGDLRAVGDERRDVALVRASGRGEVAGVPTETTRALRELRRKRRKLPLSRLNS
jgi:hypothetical protein